LVIWNTTPFATTCHWIWTMFIQIYFHKNLVICCLDFSSIGTICTTKIFVMMVFVLIMHLNVFLSFPIHWFKSIYGMCFFLQKLIWFQLVHNNKHRVWVKLIQSDKKIVLFHGHNCTLYGPTHFLVNFPMCFLSFWEPQSTWSPNLNLFFGYFCWLHKTWFHCWVPTMFSACCSFSNSMSLLVNILIGFAFLWSPLNVDKTYYVGIRRCNP